MVLEIEYFLSCISSPAHFVAALGVLFNGNLAKFTYIYLSLFFFLAVLQATAFVLHDICVNFSHSFGMSHIPLSVTAMPLLTHQ